MVDLSTNAKGAIAEAMIVAEAVRLGVRVLRPVVDGTRYDLAFDFGGDRIERVQCKWGRVNDDLVMARTGTCWHSPTRGYVRSTYTSEEVDAFAIYCGELDRCYYLPADVVAGKSYLHLRLTSARNNQRVGVTMASDYEFGAVAQLGERLAGSQKVRGSSPLSSTS